MDMQSILARRLIVGQIPVKHAHNHPNKHAVLTEKGYITWKTFNSRVNKVANALMNLGIKKGDKVATMFFNVPEVLECYFACFKIGALIVPINFRFVGREVKFTIDHSDTKCFMFGRDFLDVVRSIKSDLHKVEQFICSGMAEPEIPQGYKRYEDLLHYADHEPLVDITEDDLCFLIYTTGTTGDPKGVLLTNRNSMTNAFNMAIACELRLSDVHICIAPAWHGGVTGVLLSAMLMSNTIIPIREYSTKHVLETIEKEKVTSGFFPPAILIDILNYKDLIKYDVSSLRTGITGSAIVPVEIKKKMLSVFPSFALRDIFGMTEMSPSVTTLQPWNAFEKPDSVGQVYPTLETRVVNDNDEDVPPGVVGELIVRGPTMLQGYYKNAEATADALRNGWFHTGDLVKVDEEGFYSIVDRKKDLIISGGENVYPKEIEEVIYTHPKVREVAVIGVPDPRLGETVKAVIVLKENENETGDAIIELCKRNMAKYKVPRSVDFVQALPKNPVGKILKRELKKMYSVTA